MEEDSHSLIFETIKERLRNQKDSGKTIDTKAALVLTLVAALLAGLTNSDWFIHLSRWYLWFTLLPFFGTALSALKVVFIRKFRSDPNPGQLILQYQNKTERETRDQLIANYRERYEKNEDIITDKVFYFKLSLALMGTSIFTLMLSVLLTSHHR